MKPFNQPPSDFRFVKVELLDGEIAEGWYDHNIQKWYVKGDASGNAVVVKWEDLK